MTSPRIVSLAPSATSILAAIGARSLLVGVTRWCTDVAPVAGLPRLGDCWAFDVDRVMRARPTLVIGSVPYNSEPIARLLRQPVTFLAMNPRTLADIEADIHLLGRLTGRIAAARRLACAMRARLARIAAAAGRAGRRPRVYCEAWPHPRISSPPWAAELVRIAGGRMVVKAGQRVSDAEVARARPDVIVLAWAAAGARSRSEKALGVAAWRNVPAVRHRRVYVVRDELLNTPGPPLVQGAQELLHILHPELAPAGGKWKR